MASNGAAGSASGGTAGTNGGSLAFGERCRTVCTLSPCAQPEPACMTGYCVYESRYLPEQEYCTSPCDGLGASCPLDYECVEDDDSGKFWCLAPKPLPPADFDTACTASFHVNDCLLQDEARECQAFSSPCEDICVKGPGDAGPVCSMHCSRRFDCPTGYDCRDTPGGSTFEMSCFPSYTPEAVLGDKCMPDPTSLSLCSAEPASCVVGDDYELCDCLRDERSPDLRANYCSIPCDASCPEGYECAPAALSPSSQGTGNYCYRVPASG
jgi:hypothetical protein